MHGSATGERLAEHVAAGRWEEAGRLAGILSRDHPLGLLASGTRLIGEAAERRRARAERRRA